jgi:hypothetical protein
MRIAPRLCRHNCGVTSDNSPSNVRDPKILKTTPCKVAGARHGCFESTLTRRANHGHSFIIPQSCKRPPLRQWRTVSVRLRLKNAHPPLKLHRLAAANDRLRVAQPRLPARAREYGHEHRSQPHHASGDRFNRPGQSCRSPADKTSVARLLDRPSRSVARRTAHG